MTKVSIKYVAEMMNGEYLFTMYDDTGYSAMTTADFGEANMYDSLDDEFLESDIEKIKNGSIRMEIGSPEFKRVVKVEMKIRG